MEAKKPSVNICHNSDAVLQARKYGWNANHKLTILTNFEFLIIYDTTVIPYNDDDVSIARYRVYSYKDYIAKYDEICNLISRDFVYSGEYDNLLREILSGKGSHKQNVDEVFLQQINKWRIQLANYILQNNCILDIEEINNGIQSFINQIIFLRICEDKNLPLYHTLAETATKEKINVALEELLKKADEKYNSGIFENRIIAFNLNNEIIKAIIEDLYYPKSPYLFNIIKPNLLGKMYEMFLIEK